MSPTIKFPTIVQSKAVHGNDLTISACKVTVYWTGGNMQFYLGTSSAEATPPSTWEEVTSLTSGTEKVHTLTNTGKWLFFKIVKDYDTVISVQTDSYGRATAPAIRIRDIVEA